MAIVKRIKCVFLSLAGLGLVSVAFVNEAKARSITDVVPPAVLLFEHPEESGTTLGKLERVVKAQQVDSAVYLGTESGYFIAIPFWSKDRALSFASQMAKKIVDISSCKRLESSWSYRIDDPDHESCSTYFYPVYHSCTLFDGTPIKDNIDFGRFNFIDARRGWADHKYACSNSSPDDSIMAAAVAAAAGGG